MSPDPKCIKAHQCVKGLVIAIKGLALYHYSLFIITPYSSLLSIYYYFLFITTPYSLLLLIHYYSSLFIITPPFY